MASVVGKDKPLVFAKKTTQTPAAVLEACRRLEGIR
jgi:hypothetical protein